MVCHDNAAVARVYIQLGDVGGFCRGAGGVFGVVKMRFKFYHYSFTQPLIKTCFFNYITFFKKN
jgi:hypothetical protein